MYLAAAPALLRLFLAAAEPSIVPGVDLEWRAPPGCPDAAAITRMVGALLHRSSRTDPAATRVRAVVARVAAGRWELRLDLFAGRGRGRRIARADDCHVLARAAALLIAIHRDPLAAALGLDVPAPAPPGASEPAVPPAPDLSSGTSLPPAPDLSSGTPSSPAPDLSSGTSPSPAPDLSSGTSPPPVLDLVEPLPDAPARATRAPRPPRPPATVAGHVRLDGGFDAGVLPGVGGHLGLFGGVSLRRVRLEAGLVGVPLRVLAAAEDSPGGRFDRLVGAFRACPIWTRRAVTFALCLGGEAGGLRGIARRVADPSAQWAAWVGLTLSPGLRWRVAGPLGLYFAVDGVLALTRPRFSVGPTRDPVFSAGRAGVRATFGLELQFARRNR